MSLSIRLELPPRQGIQQELSSCTGEDSGRGVGSRSSHEPRLWEDFPRSGSLDHPGHLQIGNHMGVSLIVLTALAPSCPRTPTLHSRKSPFTQQRAERCGQSVGSRRKARAWLHTSRLGSLVPLWSELAMLCPSGDLVWRQGHAGISCWLAAGSSAGPAAGILHMASRWWPCVTADFSRVSVPRAVFRHSPFKSHKWRSHRVHTL